MSGFGTVLGLALRRNWLFHAVWIAVLALLLPATISQYESLFPDPARAGAELLVLSSDPTMRAIIGPPFDLSTAFGFAAWRVGVFTSFLAAMVAGLGIVRATRAEEEEGRVELIRSGVVGRHVPLLAGITLGLLANLVLGAIVIGGLLAMGAPTAGSVALGLAIALAGAMFTGIGAVMAQLFESARTARYWTFGIILGGLYLLRSVVDGNSVGTDVAPVWTVLSWANPLSWAAQVRAFAGERWWVLLLPLALTLVTIVLAVWLESRRDLGAGVRATRPGRVSAPASLSGAAGLAWRLQRGAVIGWAVGIIVGGIGIGTLAARMEDFIAGNEGFSQILKRVGYGAEDLSQAFRIGMGGLLLMLLAIGALAMLGRLRSEETSGHAEVMLATATSRWAFAGSHLLLALATAVTLSVAAMAAVTLPSALDGGSWADVGSMAAAALALLPGSLVVIGLGMAIIGWAPRAWPLALAVVGWSIFTAWFGPVLRFPDELLRLQPWGHLPHLPADDLTWTTIVVETTLGLALIAAGLIGYRRRDIRGR